MIFIILLLITQVYSTIYGNGISLLNNSQYHFIPNGSFLQFSLSSADLGNHASQSFSKITGNINVTIFSLGENNTFNFLIFPPFISQSEQLYQCYMRIVFQQIQHIDCNFQYQYNATNGNCKSCVQNAIFDNKVTVCLNCSVSFSFSIYSDSSHFPEGVIYNPNGTTLVIIDNSNTVQQFQTHGYIQLQLGYNVQMSLSQSQQNFLQTFTIIVGVTLVIITVTACIIKQKIKAYEKKIKQKNQ